MFLTENKVLME